MKDENQHPAVKYERWIQSVAFYLTRGRPYLQMDVESEMKLSMVQDYDKDKKIPESYLKFQAKCNAKDWLRSRKVSYSYDNKFPHYSIELTEHVGIQIDTYKNIYRPVNAPHAPIFSGHEKPYTDKHFSLYHYSDHMDQRLWEKLFDDVRVKEIFELCTDEERAILINWFWNGLTCKELAGIYNMSRSWMAKRRVAIIRKMRKIVEDNLE